MFGGKSRLGGWLGDFFTIVGVIATVLSMAFGALAITDRERAIEMLPSGSGSAPREVVITQVVSPTPNPDSGEEIREVEVTRIVEQEIPVEVTRVVEIEVPGPEVEVTRVVEVEVTRIVTVTNEIVVTPTQPAAPPTATPPANTPAGTILNEGDTWKQDGRELRLLQVEYTNYTGSGPRAVVHLQFTNRTNQTIFAACESTNFVVTTNTGLRVLAEGFDGERWCRAQLSPQDSTMLGGGYDTIDFYFDYFAADVTEFVVTATDIGGIPEAKWRISLGK